VGPLEVAFAALAAAAAARRVVVPLPDPELPPCGEDSPLDLNGARGDGAPPLAPLGTTAFGPVNAVPPFGFEEFAKGMDGYMAGVGVPVEVDWRMGWDG